MHQQKFYTSCYFYFKDNIRENKTLEIKLKFVVPKSN